MTSSQGAAPVSASGFVGRHQELLRLEAAIDEIIAGRGRLLMLVGEPGIGKSRTAEELAHAARSRGVRVLSGRCHDGGGAPPYWPWRQIVRTYLRSGHPAHLAQDLGSGAADIARVVNEIRQVLPDLDPDSDPQEPDEARFRLFDGFTQFLSAVARRQPLLLILDDLHWADPPSLLLLQFIAREWGEWPLMIAGTYREIEVQADPVRGPLLASLSRERFFERIALHGLSVDEARALLESDLSTPLPVELLPVLLERTEGNPFFLLEMARHLAERRKQDGDLDAESQLRVLAAPQSVRTVIRQRLDRLTADTRRSLEVGAVMGREFGLALLANVDDVTPEILLKRLTEASTAGIVWPLTATATSARFTHSLVRDVLYEELPSERRADLHRSVGVALEQQWGFELDDHANELAMHFRLAAPTGDSQRALHYCVRAAERAAALLAYEEAVASYEQALQVAELAPSIDGPTHCRLLLGLGRAQAAASNVGEMRETFRRAADVARTLDDAESFARAAIGYARAPAVGGSVDSTAVALLEEALKRLPTQDGSVRAAVLSILADALHHSPATYERRVALCHEASAMARRLGDLPTLARTLYDRHNALFGPESLTDRLAAADELLHLAQQTFDRPMLLRAHFCRVVDLLEAAQVSRAIAEIDALERLATELREPWHHWYASWFRSAIALLEGRFLQAEQLAFDAFTHGERVAHDSALQVFSAQISMLRALQGRCAEMVSAIQGLVEQFPAMAVWRCALAYHCSEIGETSVARDHFEILAREGFTSIPRDAAWMISMTQLSDVCVHLGDARRAAVLYDQLSPYAERLAVVDRALASSGVGHRYLGVLATTMGHWDIAQHHLGLALVFHQETGMRPWVAITHLDLARLHGVRADPNLDLAHSNLGESNKLAEELGMQGLLLKGEALRQLLEDRNRSATLQSPGTPTGTPTRSIESKADPYLFMKEGDFWTLRFDDHTCRLKDALGLQYLAYLLRHPGRTFHVTELVTLVAGTQPVSRPDRVDDLSIGRSEAPLPVLDDRARAAYRRRMGELERELDEARQNNDPGTIARTEHEIRLLAEELTGSTRGSSTAERARVSVTKRLKAALQRIRSGHEGMGRHLDATVKSGYFCSYNPDQRHPIDWKF